MLKISIFDTPNRRRFVLEGKLVAPWAAELRKECREAAADLRGRELVIELKNVTSISEEGENVLRELMLCLSRTFPLLRAIPVTSTISTPSTSSTSSFSISAVFC